jgi:pyruvate/2-oxoglutarate dehydrogenase complex dihydrolipoamide acyltransferase (E2) component
VRHEIRLPNVSGATDGTVSEWYRGDGEAVAAGEAVVALDIDKIVIDVPSPAPGILTIALQTGASVAVGGLLGWVTEASD